MYLEDSRSTKVLQFGKNENHKRFGRSIFSIFTEGSDVDLISQMNYDELKLTIRCLSLTMVYFLSQLCTFLPGVIFFGCDMVNVDQKSFRHTTKKQTFFTQDEAGCDGIFDWRIRLFIFGFYLLQFLKPIFYLIFDKEIFKSVKNLCRCSCD